MLVATALVLMMTPALGLFYAGLVRSKNTLNTFMMCIAAIAIAGVIWALRRLLARLRRRRLADRRARLRRPQRRRLRAAREGTTIPHLLFMAFQATFCIITVALVSGAVVERMRFGAFLVFVAALVDPRLRGARPLGLRRRLARRRRHARLRRRHPGRDGARASRPWPRRWSSARARTTAARRSSPTTPSTSCSAPACSGSAGSASTAAAASAPATRACSPSSTRC